MTRPLIYEDSSLPIHAFVGELPVPTLVYGHRKHFIS